MSDKSNITKAQKNDSPRFNSIQLGLVGFGSIRFGSIRWDSDPFGSKFCLKRLGFDAIRFDSILIYSARHNKKKDPNKNELLNK